MELISYEAFKENMGTWNWSVNSDGDFIVKMGGIDFKVDIPREKPRLRRPRHYVYDKNPRFGWGGFIKSFRWDLLGLTQKQFAKKFGFSQESISAWEKGRNPVPRLKREIILCEFYRFIAEDNLNSE